MESKKEVKKVGKQEVKLSLQELKKKEISKKVGGKIKGTGSGFAPTVEGCCPAAA